jgi:curli production assembly/transport component CsgG
MDLLLTIAVYGFQDKTGQMKPNDKLAVFSKAVTQGAEVFLIKSLQDSVRIGLRWSNV